MKIHFSNVNFSSRTGPNTFGYRLAEELASRGHEIVNANGIYDVALVFIEPSSPLRKDAKIIQRLDGIWFKPEEFITHNKLIKETYEKCHHVIWQSEFDKNMTIHHWGNRTGTVIRNGVLLRSAHPIKREGFLESDNIFVTSSNWHPQKRLKANIDFFRRLKIYNSRLIVMGKCTPADLDEKDLGEDIAFIGDVDHETCMKIYSTADWMIHLAWLDHCPNVVVEALSQGCKVICASSGGTPELINEKRGLIISEKQQYNYELTDYDSPPSLDFSGIVLPNLTRDFDKSDIDIKLVASKYEKVFLGV